MMAQLPMKDPNAQAAAPAEGAPAPEGGEGGNDLGDLISNIGMGMSMLNEVIQGAGLPGPIAEKAQALIAGFESLAGDLAGGAQQPPQGAPKMSAQEAGGAAASPANPGMRG